MAVEPLFGLEGKKALVVGGGQGMGESSSRFLAYAGCDVAVLDVVAERAESVAELVRQEGRKSVPVVADVLDDAQIPGIVEQVEEQLGGLDVLVCIVGQAAFVSTIEMTAEQWDLDHRRNLRYFFLVSQAVARSMIRREQPGAMVGITSIDGLTSAASHASYGAAKAGLVNLVRTLAVEWARHNIRVNAIAPGSIATPRFPDTAESRERTARGLIPFKRRGTTDEIGKAVLFLASDLASYVSGVTLSVDGGWAAASISGGVDVNSLPG
jgi:NAD(P)-dependent dehydrogenase (short-subunit alcohol dehydrogenase family)